MTASYPVDRFLLHELSELQQAEYEILKEFLAICEGASLKYFIWGGSLLGAVRHGGFIPWDDDIDVAMPRDDFEIFVEIAPMFLRDDMYLSTYETDENHITLVAQIFNKDERFLLNNAEEQVKTGAWLDILVIDGAPDPGVIRKVFGLRYMYRRMICQFANFSKIVNLSKQRPWYERAAIKFATLTNIERAIDSKTAHKKLHRLIRSVPFESANYVATFMGAAKMGEVMPTSYVGEGTNYLFEELEVIGPSDYEKFLTQIYGDWRVLPPEDERNCHNVTVIEGDGADTGDPTLHIFQS